MLVLMILVSVVIITLRLPQLLFIIHFFKLQIKGKVGGIITFGRMAVP